MQTQNEYTSVTPSPVRANRHPPKRDAWIRWTHRCNGWMWSIMEGATLIVEGCEEGYDAAFAAAARHLA